ncbi:serine hydrolase domain-containing protein [Flaviflexus equikiangi]|uniref:Serine hydrolase n=1 Tax=Flaviflexus equikiangi TaxID=2758573 RepID=A0ABS2TE88_9ACTO|nr:serine hydrolase [Flaviflexus equikiangi]MBM9432637.1 serine hydrolase [Flaviflexus equikiangi]
MEFDGLVDLFESARDRNGDRLAMHYLAVKQGEREFCHAFGDRTEPSDIRSISKTVMAILLGTVNDSTFTEDTPLWPILEPLCVLSNEENRERLSRVKVKHLLNHTIGFDRALMMRDDIIDLDPADYISHIVNTPIVHEPGTHYLYSNAGFYLLSVVLQEVLGEDLKEYADRVLFRPLGIEQPEWERYGDYLAGATRLWLYPRDLIAIGEVLLHGGRGIVSADWIERMKQFTAFTPSADTPTNPYFRRWAYGSSLWLGKRDGIYFGHGTDGQSLVIVPQRQAIIVTLAHQRDVRRLEELVDKAITLLD